MPEISHAIVIVAALILSATLGSPLVQLVFHLADKEGRTTRRKKSKNAEVSAIPAARKRGQQSESGESGQQPASGESGQQPESGESGEQPARPWASEQTPELLRGGLTIGILERTAITGLLLANFPTGIAAIVAIKGLGRFHELKGPNGALASEKFVIGTLTSYLWAGLVAAIAITIQAHI